MDRHSPFRVLRPRVRSESESSCVSKEDDKNTQNKEMGELGSGSSEGTFIVEYHGASMMDSRCDYSVEMMPWIIAEIVRFSECIQVVISCYCRFSLLINQKVLVLAT